MRDKFESTPNKRIRVIAFYVSVPEESKNSPLCHSHYFHPDFHPEGEGKIVPLASWDLNPDEDGRGIEGGSLGGEGFSIEREKAVD